LNYLLGFLIFLGVLIMQMLEQVKRWLGEITEIALLLIAVGIAVEILFGASVPFFGGIVANLTALITSLGDNGLVGLISLSIIFYLFNKTRAHA
jgi:hypothetical protein